MIFNPAHPGEVLRDYLDNLSVKEAASRLGVTRAHLSRILNRHAGISAAMSLRLSAALGTPRNSGSGCKSSTTCGKLSEPSDPKCGPSLAPRNIKILSRHSRTSGHWPLLDPRRVASLPNLRPFAGLP